MLEKHPDTMTNAELYQKINFWVFNKIPESIFIDYKRELNFHTEKEKIELGKDISSLANTKGGCLVYGIDEERHSKGSAPIPKEEYGIEPINGDLIDIENIINSIVSPPLPELRIRQIPLDHNVGKYVYLIWHPKSWIAPHMVIGFKNNRYYKRGNFKSEPMEEHEVELLYHARSLSNNKLREVINNIDYGLNYLYQSVFHLKVIASPFFFSPNTKYFSYSDAHRLVEPRPTINKISSLEGVIFIGYNNKFITKAFFNGMFSICYNISDYIKPFEIKGININVLYFNEVKARLISIINYITFYYSQLNFYGPVIINLILENSENMYIHFDEIQWVERLPINDIINHRYNDSKFEFAEVFPITDILFKADIVKKNLINRIKNGFGWYYVFNE